jgi:hypothetical protein
MPLDTKEVAHFVVTHGDWEKNRYGKVEASGTVSLRLEGITQGKKELVEAISAMLPSLIESHVTDKMSTDPRSLKGRGDIVMTVNERELRRVQRENTSDVWRSGGRQV